MYHLPAKRDSSRRYGRRRPRRHGLGHRRPRHTPQLCVAARPATTTTRSASTSTRTPTPPSAPTAPSRWSAPGPDLSIPHSAVPPWIPLAAARPRETRNPMPRHLSRRVPVPARERVARPGHLRHTSASSRVPLSGTRPVTASSHAQRTVGVVQPLPRRGACSGVGGVGVRHRERQRLPGLPGERRPVRRPHTSRFFSAIPCLTRHQDAGRTQTRHWPSLSCHKARQMQRSYPLIHPMYQWRGLIGPSPL